VQYFVIALLKI